MIYIIFFYHWTYDDIVYWNEQQRNYVITNILMTFYFECRSIFMFDIWIKFENANDACESMNQIIVDNNSQNQSNIHKNKNTLNNKNWNDEQATLVNSIFNQNKNGESDVENDDNDIDNNKINDSDTDDDIDADFNDTKTFFWKHVFFLLFIIAISKIPIFFLSKWQLFIRKKRIISFENRFWFCLSKFSTSSLIRFFTEKRSLLNAKIIDFFVFLIICFFSFFTMMCLFLSDWKMLTTFFESKSLRKKNLCSWKSNAAF